MLTSFPLELLTESDWIFNFNWRLIEGRLSAAHTAQSLKIAFEFMIILWLFKWQTCFVHTRTWTTQSKFYQSLLSSIVFNSMNKLKVRSKKMLANLPHCLLIAPSKKARRLIELLKVFSSVELLTGRQAVRGNIMVSLRHLSIFRTTCRRNIFKIRKFWTIKRTIVKSKCHFSIVISS